MTFNYNGEDYEIIVVRKKTTKNIYIRIKDDLKIYVTAYILTTNSGVMNAINLNQKFIERSIDKIKNKKDKENNFYYLGKAYDIVKINEKGISLGDNKVFIYNKIKEEDIDKWYRKKAEEIFSYYFEIGFDRFNRKIPKPSLVIRKMKTRWGVCNTKIKKVTLNLELIKKPIECLEYVIVHELAHLVEANHSKAFWKVVEENYPDYKEIKKILKE